MLGAMFVLSEEQWSRKGSFFPARGALGEDTENNRASGFCRCCVATRSRLPFDLLNGLHQKCNGLVLNAPAHVLVC